MEYHLHDFFGNLGVLFILGTYFFLQNGKIASTSFSYLIFNAIGASFILVSLIGEFNLSAFLVESFWVAISLYGLYKNRHSLFNKSIQ
jgi:hypothetical protein